MPTKTRRSNRTVPLPARCLDTLADHHLHLQATYGTPGQPWPPTGYIFGTRLGTPLEPRNLTRMFGQLCDQHGIRRVPLHGLPPYLRLAAARPGRTPTRRHGDRRPQRH